MVFVIQVLQLSFSAIFVNGGSVYEEGDKEKAYGVASKDPDEGKTQLMVFDCDLLFLHGGNHRCV
jgi:hypothetical protein